MREKKEEIYTYGAMAQVASLFEHNECLPDQVSVPIDQEEYLDDCPWFIPNMRYLLSSVFDELVCNYHVERTSSESVRK